MQRMQKCYIRRPFSCYVMKTSEELNYLSGIILDASISVHREMGPGLLESVYQLCLAEELALRNVETLTMVPDRWWRMLGRTSCTSRAGANRFT